MIEFLCPNGHKIRCQAAQAGRAAKCPRCGVKFRVPDAPDDSLPKTGDSDPIISPPDFTDSGISGERAPNTGSATREPDFEFLCPNGHRLHGPASLQGRPGECPDCGSRFRIPTYEDIPAEEETEQKIGRGRAGGREGSEIGTRATQPAAAVNHATTAEATGAMFVRLWKMRPEGATVELRLRSGETIAPDQFLARASEDCGQGVFTTVEPDKTISLLVVPWAAIDRMTLRGLSEVPKEMAE
jgi:DNA-directed RNA polymerase subunit RPC12/RpoP